VSDRAPGAVLISAERIRDRVAELGRAISNDYRGEAVSLVGVLKGSLFFVADLVRAIDLPVRYELLRVSTYGAERSPQRPPEVLLAADLEIKGRHLIVVEDIADSGYTIDAVRRTLLAESPASLKVCVLLDKPARRRVPVPLDYVGFEIEDRFVVGYGLDHGERYRGLPYIAVLDPD